MVSKKNTIIVVNIKAATTYKIIKLFAKAFSRS